jgi:hypothetical protein
MQNLRCLFICRLVSVLFARKSDAISWSSVTCWVSSFLVTVWCLSGGSSRLYTKALARRVWYSTQIEGAPNPKCYVFSRIIAVGVHFQSLNLYLIALPIMLSL